MSESDDDGVRVLSMPRRRSALILLYSVLFVGAGVLLLERNVFVAVLGFLLGGAGCVVSILNLVRPQWLRLGPNEFASWQLFRPTNRWEWTNCSPFSTVQISRRQSLVAFTTEGGVENPSKRAKDSEKYLNSGYGGLTAPELADLMNGYRDRAAHQE